MPIRKTQRTELGRKTNHHQNCTQAGARFLIQDCTLRFKGSQHLDLFREAWNMFLSSGLNNIELNSVFGQMRSK